MIPTHKPVLLKEVLDFLNVQSGGRYIDATLGQGGHTLEIIRRGGEVLGIEADGREAAWARAYFESLALNEGRPRIVQANFREIGRVAAETGYAPVEGILFDLGLSTWQLKNSGRGFSFQKDEILDMRFDPDRQLTTAADLVNRLTGEELYEILTKFGEERDARKLVAGLVRARNLKEIKSTFDLVALVESARQPREGVRRSLARVFQALRLAVNGELDALAQGLSQAPDLLKPGGRVIVLSFHSLEDRLVKRQFKDWQRRGLGRILTPRPARPVREEVLRNNASRGAKLRVWQKV